jgi:choline kinase
MTAAIILAAGRGARLERYTERLPKALVRAGGRSLLDWNLAALAGCGVDTIVVVGGYRAAQLGRAGVELVIAPAWERAGPVASLLAAYPSRFDAPFLVLYGDCVHHRDNIERAMASGADVAVAGDRAWRALWNERHAAPLDDAESYRHRDGALVAIGARPASEGDIEAQFAGLVRFSPAGWQAIQRMLDAETVPPFDMTALLASLLARGLPVADVPIRGRWCEVDSAKDLRLCRKRLRDAAAWPNDWRSDRGARACR